MNRQKPLIWAILYVILFSLPSIGQEPSPRPTIAVYFSPHGGAQAAIVAAIGQAEKTVHVQAYFLTAAPIADALTTAQKRGVNVDVILDRKASGSTASQHKKLLAGGIDVYVDGHEKIAHNKIIVIDSARVLTGSYNFTNNADKDNGENLLDIQDKALAEKYEANWQEHLKHSMPKER